MFVGHYSHMTAEQPSQSVTEEWVTSNHSSMTNASVCPTVEHSFPQINIHILPLKQFYWIAKRALVLD